MDNIYPKCFCCGNTPVNGLYDGIRLNGKFICSACEKRVIGAEIGSSPYQQHLRSIKAILFGYKAC